MNYVALTAVFSAVSFVVGAASGYHDAQNEFEHDRAVAVAAQGAKDYERLKKAVEVQDSLRGDLERARAESDRMRKLLSRRKATTSRSNAEAGASGCAELLRESVELLAECRERYLSCAGRHDALAAAVK